MNKKPAFLSIFIFVTVLSLLSVPVMASIPMEGANEDYGDYGDWDWAWLYAE
jgi:hypothetical protein